MTDATEDLDLPPRARPPQRRRTLLVTLALVLVVAVSPDMGAESPARSSLFFLNADEAVEQRDDLGDDRFRLQGTVVDGSISEEAGDVSFSVVFNDVTVQVAHRGDPPELFQPDIPVVLEGQWNGETFASDRILVRHSAEYEADNGERLDEADQGTTDS